MSLQRPITAAVLAVGLGLSLVGCQGDDKPAAGASNPTTSAPTTATSTPTPTASAPTTPAAPAPAPRTKASLTKALLALEDLPSGFAIDPESAGDDDGTKLTSSDAKCKPLVKLFNDDVPPGSKVSVSREFSGGQEGPFVGEQLDALPSAAATKAYLASVKSAVSSCKKAKLTIAGAGTSPVTVAEVSAPKAGTGPTAVRITAAGGPLQGFEIHFVFTAFDDVLLSMNFDSGDIEDPTLDAADKVHKVFGTSTQGT